MGLLINPPPTKSQQIPKVMRVWFPGPLVPSPNGFMQKNQKQQKNVSPGPTPGNSQIPKIIEPVPSSVQTPPSRPTPAGFSKKQSDPNIMQVQNPYLSSELQKPITKAHLPQQQKVVDGWDDGDWSEDNDWDEESNHSKETESIDPHNDTASDYNEDPTPDDVDGEQGGWNEGGWDDEAGDDDEGWDFQPKASASKLDIVRQQRSVKKSGGKSE